MGPVCFQASLAMSWRVAMGAGWPCWTGCPNPGSSALTIITTTKVSARNTELRSSFDMALPG
jgi:hypothetical protein